MKRYLQINFATILVLVLGLAINQGTNFSALQAIAGVIIIFFLPGYNLSYLLFPKIFNPIEKISFGLTSSILLITPIIYFAKNQNTNYLTTNLVLLTIIISYLISFLAGLLALKINPDNQEEKADNRPLYYALGLFLITLGAIFVLYPFIPEADPYSYLSATNLLIHHLPENNLIQARPFFTTLTSSLSLFTNISPYNVFKYLLPLFGVSMLLPFYLMAKNYLKSNWGIFLITVAPVTLPIIMSESVITRPQVILMFTMPGILYLLYKSILVKNPWLTFFALILSSILVKFHELALLLVFAAIVTQIITVWPQAKKQPKVTLAFLFLILIAAYPHVIASNAISNISWISDLLIKKLVPLHFYIFFISHYTNIDGTQVGWPGITAFFYYGYNLGLYLPLLVIGIFSFRKCWGKDKQTILPFSPIILILTIFFIIAEVMPRFGLAYLPDRAWPFIVLSLTLFLPIYLAKVESKLSENVWMIVTIILIILSIGSVLAITYEKQGWTTKNEYQAALFIKNNTPKDSIFISQPGNGPMVSYFAQRNLTIDNIFTNSKTNEELKKTLADASSRELIKQKLEDQKESLITNLNEIRVENSDNNRVISDKQKERKVLVNQLKDLNNIIHDKQKELNKNRPYPVYILYSSDKFTGLYGSRDWWKEQNYYEANLNKLNKSQFLTKVYDKNGVTIWKFNSTN